jgi:hypothetical protein
LIETAKLDAERQRKQRRRGGPVEIADGAPVDPWPID